MKHRYILFFLLSFFVICSNSQIHFDDFDGNSNITTWFGDDCNINLNLANPYQQGINASSTVMQYHDVGGQYANVRFDAGSSFALAENIFKLKIYIPSGSLTGNQPIQVSLKVQDGSLSFPWMTQSEIIKTLQLDQWQEVSFDFENDGYINLDGSSPPPVTRTDFNRVVIQVNGEGNSDNVIAYIDDFWYGENTTVYEDPVYDNLVWSDEFNVDGPLD
ncbi:MAG: beta-glucanase, partial [Flavobacteriaceae bacterium]|nr:beta-glucanase [Flavobacteriaceae bacterium]